MPEQLSTTSKFWSGLGLVVGRCPKPPISPLPSLNEPQTNQRPALVKTPASPSLTPNQPGNAGDVAPSQPLWEALRRAGASKKPGLAKKTTFPSKAAVPRRGSAFASNKDRDPFSSSNQSLSLCHFLNLFSHFGRRWRRCVSTQTNPKPRKPTRNPTWAELWVFLLARQRASRPLSRPCYRKSC